MTREHFYFVPIVFALGVVLGSLLTWHRMGRLVPQRFDEELNILPPRTTARSLWVPLGLSLYCRARPIPKAMQFQKVRRISHGSLLSA